MNYLIGITGFARSGKDTIYKRAKTILENEGRKCCRFAFADALKYESDEFLKKNTGISAFTEDPKEKEIIRSFLVTYGTDIRRRLDENCWIKSIQDKVVEKLNEGYNVFITDVRFKNEAEWIKMNHGILTYVSRDGIKPANHEEHRQYHRYKGMVEYFIHWPTFGEEEINKCDEHVLPFLAHILKQEPAAQLLM